MVHRFLQTSFTYCDAIQLNYVFQKHGQIKLSLEDANQLHDVDISLQTGWVACFRLPISFGLMRVWSDKRTIQNLLVPSECYSTSPGGFRKLFYPLKAALMSPIQRESSFWRTQQESNL